MSRRVAALVVAVATLVLVVALVFLLRGGTRSDEASTGATEAATTSSATEPWEATLWLPSESERLAPLAVRIESGAAVPARGRAVIAALLAASPGAPLDAVFPIPVRVGRLLVVDETAYVDLRPVEGGEPPPTGSRLELLRVYSVVHTLVGNVPEIGNVVLLWNGAQRQGFPGHVDTTRPLTPRSELIEQ